jgi:hypothetical protein
LQDLNYSVNFARIIKECKILNKDKDMTKNPLLYAGLFILLIGAILIAWSDRIASSKIIFLGGVLFIIAGSLNLGLNLRSKKTDATYGVDEKKSTLKRNLALIVSEATAVLGVVMIGFKDTFVPYIPFAFGLFALCGAIMMFYTLAIGIRPVMLPGWLYAFPTLILIDAVYIYFQKTPDDDKLVMTLAGIAALLYGLCSIIVATHLAKIRRIDEELEESQEIHSLDDEK